MRAYQLMITEAQAELLAQALELLVQVDLLRLDRIADFLATRSPNGMGDLAAVRRHLIAAQQQLIAQMQDAAPPDRTWVAYDVGQVIRHRLAGDRSKTTGTRAESPEPLRSAQAEPLPTIVPADPAQCRAERGGRRLPSREIVAPPT